MVAAVGSFAKGPIRHGLRVDGAHSTSFWRRAGWLQHPPTDEPHRLVIASPPEHAAEPDRHSCPASFDAAIPSAPESLLSPHDDEDSEFIRNQKRRWARLIAKRWTRSPDDHGRARPGPRHRTPTDPSTPPHDRLHIERHPTREVGVQEMPLPRAATFLLNSRDCAWLSPPSVTPRPARHSKLSRSSLTQDQPPADNWNLRSRVATNRCREPRPEMSRAPEAAREPVAPKSKRGVGGGPRGS